MPSRAVFQEWNFSSESCNRSVQIIPLGEDVFQYIETGAIKTPDASKTYTDCFKIRYWESKTVLKIAQEEGLTIEKDLSHDFSGSGAEYFLLRKS